VKAALKEKGLGIDGSKKELQERLLQAQ